MSNTLEEFIKKYQKNKTYWNLNEKSDVARNIRIGAKWQQEQIYNKIKELYENENITGFSKRAYAQCLDIVEEFKKK
jgi:hypothetical protein